MRTSALAKLSRPKLFGVVPRERLFRLLDERRRHPLVWISGPPGAGKTTLVASYLESRKTPGPWYQLDAGDGDPATFFYYLREAASPRKGAPLPLLTAEYLPDLSGFSRRFFPGLFARLAPWSALVLDNFQDAPEGSPLPRLVHAAAAEIPEGINVVVLSRTDPPAEFTRLVASGQAELIGPEALQLTLEETERIASLDQPLDEPTIRALHERTGGWAAGVVLMAKRYRWLGRQSDPIDGHEATSAYFMSEIFDREDRETRELLLHTAWIPRLTAKMAEKLTGNLGAGKLLADLSRRHCFTSRTGGAAPSYEYHALFREFLLARTKTAFTDAQQTRLRHRAARLLEANAQHEDAFPLYRDSGDLTAAVQLILTRAPTMVAQGRWQMLATWIESLSRHLVEETPWLLYWLGVSRMPAGPQESRSVLERAYERFVRAQVPLGQALAAAAVVETYFLEMNDLGPLDRWVSVLVGFLGQGPAFPSDEPELRVLTSTGNALLFRQPRHRLLSECVARILAKLSADLDPNAKVAAGTFLLNRWARMGESHEAQRVSAAMVPLLPDPRVTPLNRAWWWTWFSYFPLRAGARDEMLAVLDKALGITQDNGMHFAASLIRMYQALTHLLFGEPRTSERILSEVEPLLDRLRPIDAHFYASLQCLLALSDGNLDAALRHGREALGSADKCGGVMIRALCLTYVAAVLARRGEHDSANAHAREADALLPPSSSDYLGSRSLLLQAYLALLRGDKRKCGKALSKAFLLCRQNGYMNSAYWPPGMMQELAAFALEHGIELDYVKRLIQTLKLLPKTADVERWPWPVKVYTLGRFALVKDGKPLRFEGKPQHRPLEFLKALVALGGREVHGSTLIKALWPDSANGEKVLEITLRRLRELLGNAQAIALHEGKLTLDTRYFWVDVWAFERRLNRLEATLGNGGAEFESTETAFRLYQGHFLAHEPERPWLIGMRDRLRSRFLRAARSVGHQLERSGELAAAQALYERALEADSLAEEIYRGLMLCLEAQDRRAEALEVYRRCRHNLSVILGVSPSAQTEAIYRRLLGGRSAKSVKSKNYF